MKKIRVGIVGFGNIGLGAEKAVTAASDMELVAVFSRRSPEKIKTLNEKTVVLPLEKAFDMPSSIDVMILCGGSATDLPEQGPLFAKHFNIVDSFDTHAKIPQYLARVGAAATSTTAVISSGWDPGLFSVMRTLMGAMLPDGDSYTFWGRGVSQGHSVAIRSIAGVAGAIQYSVPIEEAVEKVRSGNRPELTARQKHLRECYVAVKEGFDRAEIEMKIKTMPDYFADYDTSVTFVSEEELRANHSKMPHGGLVLRSGSTGENSHVMEFSLELESNPDFTASILVASARAAARLAAEGAYGAKTLIDIPLYYFHEDDRMKLITDLL